MATQARAMWGDVTDAGVESDRAMVTFARGFSPSPSPPLSLEPVPSLPQAARARSRTPTSISFFDCLIFRSLPSLMAQLIATSFAGCSLLTRHEANRANEQCIGQGLEPD